jgi:geranylgeranyl diphosphate synthase type I
MGIVALKWGELSVNAGPDEWLFAVQSAVERRLERLFAEKTAAAAAIHPSLAALVDVIRDVTLRGGKRLRAALLVAGFRCVAPADDLTAILGAAVAAELLQTFLLIHDDWMDQDEMRRGRPSAHVLLAQKYGDVHTGASAAVLAGDLASSYAWEALASTPFPVERVRLAVRAFWEMEEQVALGQMLDLLSSRADGPIETVHLLKTASYSVRGPLRIGALLGNGTDVQLQSLDAYACPLGLAFQLRDDLLGAFGDSSRTGKPVGNDLRAGKRTSLMADALAHADAAGLALLARIADNPGGSAEDIAAAHRLFETCGSRQRIEDRISQAAQESLAALDDAPLDAHGVALLRRLAERVAVRVS